MAYRCTIHRSRSLAHIRNTPKADIPTQLLQCLDKCYEAGLPCEIVCSQSHENTDPPHPVALLRPRRERPRRRAADQRDELAPFHHSITSSASASSLSGIWRPNAFAVLRLMTNSNLVGCTTGKSPGLAPLRIRPT